MFGRSNYSASNRTCQNRGSFYPSIMDSFKIAPAHLNKGVFVKLIHYLKETRLKAKYAYKHNLPDVIPGVPNKVAMEALKIVINAIYGKLGFEKGMLYDRLAQMQVTINGQLMILMLIEELELNGIHCVSGNTDGIVVKLYKDKFEDFERITKAWEEMTNMTADSEDYEIYANRDINNYLIRELNGHVTQKGDYDPEMYRNDLKKGYDMPIVSKAASEYFLNGTPIMETIMACTNILDFCKTQNIAKKYRLEYTYIDKGVKRISEVQRNTRYYITNNDGGILEKVEKDNEAKRSRLAAGSIMRVLNSLDDVDIAFRNINYEYYYNEAFKLVNPIMLGIGNKGRNKTRAKKYGAMYNPLFDDEQFDIRD